MIEVATSLLNVKEEEVIRKIYDLEVAGTDYFHIDVMDGKLVKRDTSETMRKYAEYVKNVSNIPMEVHLMVEDVENYIKSYLALEPHMIIFHYESAKTDAERIKWLHILQESNCKIGMSIKPNTPVGKLYEFLPYLHRVLIMTVEPGEGGQELIPETIEKIQELNKFTYENGIDIDIEVDGGINDKTAQKVIEAGANILVSGSYIIHHENMKEAIKILKRK